jgi:hypothetical protein
LVPYAGQEVSMITTTNEIYEFVELTSKKCRENGYDDIAKKLDEALHLGSSGLEILGAIRAVIVSEAPRLEKIVDEGSVRETVEYVNRAFGIG